MKVISLYTFLMVYTFLYINEITGAAIICDDNTKTSPPPPASPAEASSKSIAAVSAAAAASATQQSNNRENHVNQTADVGGVMMVNKGVKKLLHSIQCTLEKAKPWVDELEHEAKRLEQAAKRLGLGILHTFGEFMEKLMGDIRETVVTTTTIATTGNKIVYSTDTPLIKKDLATATTTTSTAKPLSTNYIAMMENDRKSDEILSSNSKAATEAASTTSSPTTTTTTITPTVSTLRSTIINRISETETHNAAAATLPASVSMAIDENDENEIFNSYEANSIICPIGFKPGHKGLCERQQ